MGIKTIFAQILELPEDEITLESSPANVGDWTSLKQIMLISILESEYNIRFSMKEMKELKCVGAFVETIREKGVKSAF